MNTEIEALRVQMRMQDQLIAALSAQVNVLKHKLAGAEHRITEVEIEAGLVSRRRQPGVGARP